MVWRNAEGLEIISLMKVLQDSGQNHSIYYLRM